MEKSDLRVHPSKILDCGSPVLKVTVGSENARTFYVHKSLICSSSDYFERATAGEWRDSRDGQVRLTKQDPDVFDIYVHWLYRGTLPVRIDASPEADQQPEFLQLAQAHVLGDVLQDSDFSDAAVDAMRIKIASGPKNSLVFFPGAKVIRYVYENTLATSKARQAVVDVYAEHGCSFWLVELAGTGALHQEFVFGLTLELFGKLRPGTVKAKSSTVQAKSIEYRKF